MTTKTFKIQRTQRRAGFGTFVEGKGFVMFGGKPDGKWFERYFSTAEKAVAFAQKRGWPVEIAA